MDVSAEARQKAADAHEAMPDGSFPVRNRADLARAILAIGRAKDPVAVKRFLIKRARQLDAVDLLPSSWGIK